MPEATAPTRLPKLSAAQHRVMKWLGKGWHSNPGVGSAVLVNGSRICNIDTMMTLQRLGLVCVDEQRCWSATPAGKQLTKELRL